MGTQKIPDTKVIKGVTPPTKKPSTKLFFSLSEQKWITRRKVCPSDTVTMIKGVPAHCHRNVAWLFYWNKIDHIATGYATDLEGHEWIEHSWGMRKGQIVETTLLWDGKQWIEFNTYFGVTLTKRESNQWSNEAMEYGGFGSSDWARGVQKSASPEFAVVRYSPDGSWEAAPADYFNTKPGFSRRR